MEEGPDGSSEVSEDFWDELESDDDSETGQPEVVVIDELDQVQLM